MPEWAAFTLGAVLGAGTALGLGYLWLVRVFTRR